MKHRNDEEFRALAAAFGPRLKQLREEQGLSQTELARRIGLAGATKHSRVSRYESGQYLPDLFNFRRLCRALDCSADQLLEVEE